MRAVAHILVKLAGGEGIVFQPGERFEYALTPNVVLPVGQPLGYQDRYRPEQVWLSGGRCLIGGLLPPGAVRAEVIDETGRLTAAGVGEGVYAAVVEQSMDAPSVAVCCRDDAGVPVRRPLPGDYPSRPVTDAEDPCPACGAVRWEECVPTERWRGTRGGPDGNQIISPIIVCRSCGHEEDGGQVFRFATNDPDTDTDDQEAAAARRAQARADWRRRRWHPDAATLRAATFPIYAAASWPAQLIGSGSSDGRLEELTVAHHASADPDFDEPPQIEVTTSARPPHEPEIDAVRSRLVHWAAAESVCEPRADLSDAAVMIASHAQRRRRRAATHAAARTDGLLTLDGAQWPFVMLSNAVGAWVAIRRHGDLTLTIAGRDVDPTSLSIETIADPLARLLGPEPTP
jgi:hypothetical protein